ncbi:type III secretion system translocon subunit SctE (plasmid) [Burkholderia pyrrocinia]|uniref:type III secretion system translocon subunit SctE n=1 Tax=Burkholderia pyrrocinia TaxID=60550 RepID=UPI0038B69EE0
MSGIQYIRNNQHRINKYQQQPTLPSVRKRVASLDTAAIDRVMAEMQKVAQREISKGQALPGGFVPRGVDNHDPELAPPAGGERGQDPATLIEVGRLLATPRGANELDANARRWNDANLQAQGRAAVGASESHVDVHGAAAVTLMMAELGDAKAADALSATAQNAQIGLSRAQATQAALEKAAQEFDKAINDLKGKPEKAEMLKAFEAFMNGAHSYTLADGHVLTLIDDNTALECSPADSKGCLDDLREFANIVKDFCGGAGVDFAVWGSQRSDGTPFFLFNFDGGKPGGFDTQALKSKLGDKLSQTVDQLESAIQADTKALDAAAAIDPTLYGRIDQAGYKSILVSEDDVLKELDKVEQDEASASGPEKDKLQKREAELKKQLTADLKVNAHVDVWKALSFGDMTELGMVRDILKRVKEMADKGELDGIDKSVIEAAEKALQTQASMLDAMSHLHGAAEVTMMFGALAGVMEQNNETELNNNEHLNQVQTAARVKDLQKKSDEYEAAARKAEQMQKTMGCVGKILGWAITAVSVVAAAFTGGASLALAGVGLALAAGDEIYQAATGKSFMEEAMKPVMDAVVKPVMDFLSKVATKMLEAFGVAKEQAELAGSIMAAVYTGIVITAVTVAGGELVGKLASKVASAVAEQVGKMMETSIGQMLKEGMENLADKVGVEEISARTTAAMGRMRKALGVDTEEGLQQARTIAKGSESVMRVGNDATQGTMQVLTQNAVLEADKKRRDIKMDEFDMKVLKEMISGAIEVFAKRNQALMSVLQDMSSSSATEFTTGQFVLRNMARSI